MLAYDQCFQNIPAGARGQGIPPCIPSPGRQARGKNTIFQIPPLPPHLENLPSEFSLVKTPSENTAYTLKWGSRALNDGNY